MHAVGRHRHGQHQRARAHHHFRFGGCQVPEADGLIRAGGHQPQWRRLANATPEKFFVPIKPWFPAVALVNSQKLI
jgi:hypothetical protein